MPDTIKVGFAVKTKQGDLLKALKERKWTQKKAAEFLGLTQNAFLPTSEPKGRSHRVDRW